MQINKKTPFSNLPGAVRTQPESFECQILKTQDFCLSSGMRGSQAKSGLTPPKSGVVGHSVLRLLVLM